MKNAVFLASLALLGCKHDPVSQQSAEPNKPADSVVGKALPYIITDSGIVVYWESDIAPEKVNPDRDKIEQWWIEIQQCTQLNSDEAPIVRVVNDIYGYCTSFKPGVIAGYCDGVIFMTAHSVNTRRIWKHESLHYILDVNGLEEHNDHEPDYLWQCEWN